METVSLVNENLLLFLFQIFMLLSLGRKNHTMAWIERDLKDHLVLTPAVAIHFLSGPSSISFKDEEKLTGAPLHDSTIL